MSAFYNEHDPAIAAWLRELIRAGLIADGDVDERSIVDLRPADLAGFAQCHFFAGIGGWSYALRLAGWGDTRPVWTGSCPCQPFSSAGAKAGGDDPRHLWPAWFRLIRECKPDVVFGEQVEAAVNHGWLDLVCDDLEREGYACGACGLPAASVGAPHIRQRLWFVAESNSSAVRQHAGKLPRHESKYAKRKTNSDQSPEYSGSTGELADTSRERFESERLQLRTGKPRSYVPETGRGGETGELGHANSEGPQGQHVYTERERERLIGSSSVGNFWSDCDWIPCRDGKARPVEPGTFPLATGAPARMVRLRGYGNSIVPDVAAAFIRAYHEARG
jgi:DNA (cytosine-5)-methyltransferase 1